MADSTPESLIPQFEFEKLLNQDQAGRRIVLQGKISSQPALLIAERAAFSSESTHLETFSSNLSQITNLGANDIYHWYLASTNSATNNQPPNLKINLIYPCGAQHIKKYTSQAIRLVTETPEIYTSHVRPYIQAKRDEGRLNWVFNILDGITEQEDVLFRSTPTTPANEKYILLPDLNWDRKTLGSLHLLALVERRDIWSVRDLRKKHVRWLKRVVQDIADTVAGLYEGLESDMLKFYVHYQPTYYHFHIHVVHVALEAGATQAVGKALSLNHIISQLESMAGDEEAGMADVELSFTLGEASELWNDVFLPLKEKRLG